MVADVIRFTSFGVAGAMISPTLLLLLNVGCFFFSCSCNGNDVEPSIPKRRPTVSKKKKISPIVSHSPHYAPTLKNLLITHDSPNPTGSTSAGSISLSLRFSLKHIFSPNTTKSCGQQLHRSPPTSGSFCPHTVHPFGAAAANVPLKRPSFASRADVHPCPSCGEVFGRPHLLDLHQVTKHALAELANGDSGNSIVRIIFQTGWNRRSRETALANSESFRTRSEIINVDPKTPTIHRILKIQNTSKTLARFEEYRETVKSRAAARVDGQVQRNDEERCIADGNERLRFYCATCLCSLEKEGTLETCGNPFCVTCTIVRHGFDSKTVTVDGVATQGSGWAAHASVPEGVEREFGFVRLRRAILVCRVLAGRVGVACDVDGVLLDGDGVVVVVGEERRRTTVSVESTDAYDSVAVSRGRHGAEELVVFDARAVLPCFVVFYTV